jgi:DNA-binding protein WhiA
LLGRIEVDARVREHRGWAAYVKRVEAVGTVLAAVGAHDAYLRWESGAVLKGVHVEAARLANADAANARRLARAAVRHLDAIDALEASRGLEALPRALREVAEVRRAHPQASLDELARLCDPPISKAAAADRLRRLEILARAPA